MRHSVLCAAVMACCRWVTLCMLCRKTTKIYCAVRYASLHMSLFSISYEKGTTKKQLIQMQHGRFKACAVMVHNILSTTPCLFPNGYVPGHVILIHVLISCAATNLHCILQAIPPVIADFFHYDERNALVSEQALGLHVCAFMRTRGKRIRFVLINAYYIPFLPLHHVRVDNVLLGSEFLGFVPERHCW